MLFSPFHSPFEHPDNADHQVGITPAKPDTRTSLQGQAELQIEHQPYPRLAVQAEGRQKPSGNQVQITDLILGGEAKNQFEGTQTVRSYTDRTGTIESWIVDGFLDLPTNDEVRIGHLVGHLYNFGTLPNGNDIVDRYAFGRSHARRSRHPFGPWVLTLDALKQGEDYKAACQKGRFTLTHVLHVERAKPIERERPSLFNGKQASEVSEFLELCLGFIAGSYVGPSLVAGRREEDPFVWVWPGPKLESPRNRRSNWAFVQPATGCMAFIETMWNVWKDRRHRDWLQRAISIYLEASRGDLSLDVRIAIAQTGIEMMASYLLTEKTTTLTPAAYNDLHTAAQIEALLVLLSIDRAIPEGVACKARSPNGTIADAVADVRNAIIHPTTNNRGWLKALDPAVFDHTWQVLLEFLELSILFATGYSGKYATCITGAPSSVLPWLVTP